jgi:hypothetical protein
LQVRVRKRQDDHLSHLPQGQARPGSRYHWHVHSGGIHIRRVCAGP